MKDLLEKLAELRIQERLIKEQIDEIYPTVLESVKEYEDGTIIEIPSGKFTVSFRRTWTYSPACETAAEALKKQKKEEEQKGLATYSEKPSVVFKEAYGK